MSKRTITATSLFRVILKAIGGSALNVQPTVINCYYDQPIYTYSESNFVNCLKEKVAFCFN